MSPDEIRRLFAAPDLRWIVERLRRRVQRGQPLTGTLTLQNARPEQRVALDNLLGRRGTTGSTLSVPIVSLAEATGLPDGPAILKACFGEVEDLRASRERRESDWARVFASARDRLRLDSTGIEWIDSLRDGLLKRLAGGDPDTGGRLLSVAVDIWLRMPFQRVTLAELGAEVTGNTHALDRNQPLSPLLLRGLKFRSGHDGNKSAANRRAAWESVGVVVDRLSAPALTFNLRANPGTRLAGILDAYRRIGHPAYLTYQLIRECRPIDPFDPLPDGMRRVFVAENPAVVEIATAELGPRCAPLICTEGQPASAVRELLERLGNAGADIRIQADFDWPGLGFVDQLLRLPNTAPWRMDAATYRSATGTVALSGRRSRPGWASELAAAMDASGQAVYEEQILPALMADLDSEHDRP